jgi:hypothetical protein
VDTGAASVGQNSDGEETKNPEPWFFQASGIFQLGVILYQPVSGKQGISF